MHERIYMSPTCRRNQEVGIVRNTVVTIAIWSDRHTIERSTVSKSIECASESTNQSDANKTGVFICVFQRADLGGRACLACQLSGIATWN